jgi:hypothetical protein
LTAPSVPVVDQRHDRAPDLLANGVDAMVLATAAGSVISPSMVLPVPP